MRLLTSFIYRAILSVALLNLTPPDVVAQCNCTGGVTPSQISYQQVGVLGQGAAQDSLYFDIPRFDPSLGTLMCVDVSAQVTGVVSFQLENYEDFFLRYRVRLDRFDEISGTGLNSPIVNALSKTYPNYWLDADDGVFRSGSDYLEVGPDTVLNKQLLNDRITNNIVDFLGMGTVSFAYTRGNSVMVQTASGDYYFVMASTNEVEFVLTYNYCPAALLAANKMTLNASKKDDLKAVLQWSATNDDEASSYVIETSRSNTNFAAIGSVEAKGIGSGRAASYKYEFAAPGNGVYNFRVKQIKKNGQFSYSAIKTVTFNALDAPVRIYPNPATDFFTVSVAEEGKYTVQVVNSTGQQILSNLFTSAGKQLKVTLQQSIRPGVYNIIIRNENGLPLTSTKLLIK
jgi:hypothetical protein